MPTFTKDDNVKIGDFGLNKVTIYDSRTGKTTHIASGEFLSYPEQLEPGTYLIFENAHMGCARKKSSKAQWYTDEELLQFYQTCKDNGVHLLLFPEQSTGKARNYAQLCKTDENDALAIYNFLLNFNISLQKPPKSFEVSKKREEGHQYKDYTNAILNNARGGNGKSYVDKEDYIVGFLHENIEEIIAQLSETDKETFGLTNDARYKRNDKRYGKKGQMNLNHKDVKLTQIYTMASMLLDQDGSIRTRYAGDMPGWKFIKSHVLCMSSQHRKGGVARSNFYNYNTGIVTYISKKIAEDLGVDQKVIKKKRRHGRIDPETNSVLPKSTFTKEEDALFVKYRRQYCKSMKNLFMALKHTIRNSRMGG